MFDPIKSGRILKISSWTENLSQNTNSIFLKKNCKQKVWMKYLPVHRIVINNFVYISLLSNSHFKFTTKFFKDIFVHIFQMTDRRSLCNNNHSTTTTTQQQQTAEILVVDFRSFLPTAWLNINPTYLCLNGGYCSYTHIKLKLRNKKKKQKENFEKQEYRVSFTNLGKLNLPMGVRF